MTINKITKLLFVIVMGFLLLLCSGCATRKYIYPHNELEVLLEKRMNQEKLESVIVPFKANVEMKIFAQQAVIAGQSTKMKCQKLVNSILQKSNLNIKYNKHLTKSAIDLFNEGQGNCLAYTNLFIAMARSIGIRAFFADASLRVHSIDEKEGMIVNNGHICAVVYDEPKLLFIDFTERIMKNVVGYEFIDDIEAIAHFYNNMGYEKRKHAQQAGKEETNDMGIQEFLTAIKICPDFYRAYNNLGVVYQQTGDINKAMHYYEEALRINPDFPSGYSNLGMIYYHDKKFDKAKTYFKKGIQVDRSNPYMYYYMGLIESREDNLEKAKHFLIKAIRLKDDLIPAHLSLSRIYKKLGNDEKAREELERAQFTNQK